MPGADVAGEITPGKPTKLSLNTFGYSLGAAVRVNDARRVGVERPIGAKWGCPVVRSLTAALVRLGRAWLPLGSHAMTRSTRCVLNE
jgi:hypothetical protein